MAAYAALVSVMQTIDQIENNPHSSISLTANLTFLQQFLEGYNPHVTYSPEADPSQSRIAEAAYAAEDAIDSYIVDRILARSTNQAGEINSPQFYQGMERVIEEMDLVKAEVKAKVKEMEENTSVQIKKLMVGAGSFRSSSSPAQKVTTVGLNEVLYEMLDKVAGGGLRRQIIPIVGMGGLGKTTLARSIYENPLIKERFDVCAWSTVSQVHNTRKILVEILAQVDKEKEKGGDLSEYELGEKLYRYLIGRRYLIVMDDMWSVEAWDGVSRFLPENENGSRVVVTTRLSNLASEFNYSNGLDMKFLDETSSWDLFSTTVFGEETFPPQLECREEDRGRL